MDFIVKLPRSPNPTSKTSFDSVLVIVDRLTKMAHFVPCNETIEAPDVARLFVQHVIANHSLPSDVVSDCGPVFVSNFLRSVYKSIGVDQKLSTAFHPQTDGQTERVNQVLKQYLRMYCNYQQDDWVALLPLAQFAYNNCEHSTTKVSPFFANYGYHPRVFVHGNHDTPDSPVAQEHTQNLHSLQEYLKREIRFALDQQAKYYDRSKLPAPAYTISQMV